MTHDEDAPPLLSVVVAAYQAEAVLPQCLASLAAAAAAGVEVVVVDDGSRDGTAGVAETWSGFPVHLVRQANTGPGPARNAGVQAAGGRFVTFLDSDDVVEPRWHDFLLQAVAGAPPGPGLVTCGMRYVEPDGSSYSKRPRRRGPALGGLEVLLLPGAFAVRRDLFLGVGGYDPIVRYGEHHELGIRIAARLEPRDVVGTQEVLVVKHHDRRPARLDEYAEAKLRSAEYILTTHEERLAADPLYRSRTHSVAGEAALMTGRRAVAARHMLAAARLRPREPRLWARHGKLVMPMRLLRLARGR